MAQHTLANNRRNPTIAVVVVLLAAATMLPTATGPYRGLVSTGSLCCAELVAAAAGPWVDAQYSISAKPDESATTGLVLERNIKQALPAGVAPELGLQVKTILAARAVSAAFHEIQNIGGARPDAMRWHPNGLAIDVMIPNYQSAEGKALGDRVVEFAFKNAARFDLNHVIWRQVYYPPHGPPKMMGNLGSDNANHYTHVHIATNGDGYPTGSEIYFR